MASSEVRGQGGPQSVQQPEGYWETPFDHAPSLTTKTIPYPNIGRRVAYTGDPILSGTFTPDPPTRMLQMFPPLGANGVRAKGRWLALHMSLIPIGPDQSKIMIFSHQHYSSSTPANETRPSYWSVLDPITKSFTNFCSPYAEGQGDLFCSGHTWLADGRLLVAGGTTNHGNGLNGNGWVGSKKTYIYDTSIDLNNAETLAIGTTEIVKTVTNPSNQALDPWKPGPDLSVTRWYPSVITVDHPIQHQTGAIVAGGTNNGTGINSYQVWQPSLSTPEGVWKSFNSSTVFAGPSIGAFTDYPRISLLSTGQVASAGMPSGTDRVDPILAPSAWLNDPTWTQAHWRGYGTSLLYPIDPAGNVFDLMLAIGGGHSGNPVAEPTVQAAWASAAIGLQGWSPLTGAGSVAPLNEPRMLTNSVLLPNETILVVGGRKNRNLNNSTTTQSFGCTRDSAFEPEVYENGSWRKLAASPIIRDYHSTALLLPNGNVLVAGGESRRWQEDDTCVKLNPKPPGQDRFGRNPIETEVDYQIFVPPYNQGSPNRPRITNMAVHGSKLLWQRGSTYSLNFADLPSTATIAKVLLVWPGSVTHHSDGNQRCVRMQFTAAIPFPPTGSGQLNITIPSYSEGYLPGGHYMVFLETSEGAICQQAAWVEIK